MATHQAHASSTEAAILSRMIHPEQDDLPDEVARALLRLRLDRQDMDRLHELVTKNQDDALTVAERDELESYLRISLLVDLMHAKARLSLKNHA